MLQPPLATRLAAALGDRYLIGDEIGSGGMAVVHSARDLRHGRTVAVKVLRPELAASIGDERFLREIELAAGLQHPHILPVYDSGAGSGLLYYVMPFVEGEALSTRIERDGALSIDEAVRVAGEVASALGYAHARGIIHRDVKPENILLSAGHALVADFGIARASTAGARITATGMAIGTPMYMSPEQALGSEDVDARTDIYSLGCVLYEMLTGRQPFEGASLQAILAQSITAPRPRVRSMRRDVPAALDAVVSRALAREPNDRFASAEAFGSALVASASGTNLARGRWLVAAAAVLVALAVAVAWKRNPSPLAATSPVVATDARVIVVLPFAAGGTAGGANGAFGEGLVDLLSTNLDGAGGIRTVDPRTARRRWRARAGTTGALDRAESLALGRELAAGAVLTGDVVAIGPRVRVTAELTSVAGAALARAQVDGPADSVFALVDTLSVRLLRDIWRATSPIPELRVSAFTTGSLQAMRAYLDGESHYRRSDWAAASRSYAQAIEQDSAFALAYLRLMSSYEWLGVDFAGRQAVGVRLRSRLGRLAPRERTLAIGTMLYQAGATAALDTAIAFTRRYPDNLDGWMLLGESRYHARAVFAPTAAELLEPFERVAALDPSRLSAYAHMLDVDVLTGDSARFALDFQRMRTAAGSDSALSLYTLFRDALWGPPGRATGATRALVERENAWVGVAAAGALEVPGRVPLLVDALGAMAGSPRGDSVQVYRVALLLASGRHAEAEAAAQVLRRRVPDIRTPYRLLIAPLVMGVADSASTLGVMREAATRFSGRPFGHLLAAEIGVASGDSAAITRAVSVALATDSMVLPRRFHGYFEMVPAWGRVARGEPGSTAELARRLHAVDFGLHNLTGAARFTLARALARDPSTRHEGIRLLRHGFHDDVEYASARLRALADALRAGNDAAGADSASLAADRLWTTSNASARASARRR